MRNTALHTRILQPELLDELPADDPAAMHSRRDLRRVNWLMGNHRAVAGALAVTPSLQSIAEIGAGDGTFLLRVLSRFKKAGGQPRRAWLIDRQPVVSRATLDQFSRLGCSAQTLHMDVLEPQSRFPQVDAALCNLFLHHFEGGALNVLLSRIAASADQVVACEPRRASFALAATRLLGLIGCNEVTRHDAAISVRAGFAGQELTRLWSQPGWKLQERSWGLFSHLFVATRLTKE